MCMRRPQCVVLSEGYNLYYGSPERVLGWFAETLGYPYSYQRDGAVSDWLMDLVSVGFQKPESFRHRHAPPPGHTALPMTPALQCPVYIKCPA